MTHPLDMLKLLTIKEYYAGLALQGRLANSQITKSYTSEEIAIAAVVDAENLLNALNGNLEQEQITDEE